MDQDIYLYHAQPHLNRDGMRNLVVPDIFVDISETMETKLKMLGSHESQRQWLDETQGLDNYLESMSQASAEVARLSAQADVLYSEGFRQHRHVGFSARDRDLLAEILGSKVTHRGAASPP
jgi:LmbE family N-acetylglucosaminyl deacetylase